MTEEGQDLLLTSTSAASAASINASTSSSCSSSNTNLKQHQEKQQCNTAASSAATVDQSYRASIVSNTSNSQQSQPCNEDEDRICEERTPICFHATGTAVADQVRLTTLWMRMIACWRGKGGSGKAFPVILSV